MADWLALLHRPGHQNRQPVAVDQTDCLGARERLQRIETAIFALGRIIKNEVASC